MSESRIFLETWPLACFSLEGMASSSPSRDPSKDCAGYEVHQVYQVYEVYQAYSACGAYDVYGVHEGMHKVHELCWVYGAHGVKQRCMRWIA